MDYPVDSPEYREMAVKFHTLLDEYRKEIERQQDLQRQKEDYKAQIQKSKEETKSLLEIIKRSK